MPRSNASLTEDLNTQKALVESLEKQVAYLAVIQETLAKIEKAEAKRLKRPEDKKPEPKTIEQVEQEPLSKEGEESANDLIKKFADEGITGADEALKGLTKLFGADNPNKMNMGFTFDEEGYERALPHFKEAFRAVKSAGKTLKDFVKLMVKQFV